MDKRIRRIGQMDTDFFCLSFRLSFRRNPAILSVSYGMTSKKIRIHLPNPPNPFIHYIPIPHSEIRNPHSEITKVRSICLCNGAKFPSNAHKSLSNR
jgi:hypothetical protein